MKQPCQFKFYCVWQSERRVVLTHVMVQLFFCHRDAFKKMHVNGKEGRRILCEVIAVIPQIDLLQLHMILLLIALQWLVN